MIERGPEIMNNVPGHTENVKREGGHSLKFVGMKEGYGVGSDTRIWIGREYCSVLEGQNFGCEITEVLLGPLDFNADKDDSVVGV